MISAEKKPAVQKQPRFFKKYPEFTLAIETKAVEAMGLRKDMLEDKPFWWFEDDGGSLTFSDETPNSTLVNSHLVIRQRQRLEQDQSCLQILPYVLIGYPRDYDFASVTTYYRKKGHGEERLQGSASIGWGGHPEVTDLVWKENGDIDLKATTLACVRRELDQECIFIDSRVRTHVVTVSPNEFIDGGSLKFSGFIHDTRNPKNEAVSVGSVHLAVVYFLSLPSHIVVKKRENEHLDGPVMTLDELTKTIDEFEPWSEIIIRDHYTRRQAVEANMAVHTQQVQDAEYHRLAAAAGQVEAEVAASTIVQESVLEGALPGLKADAHCATHPDA